MAFFARAPLLCAAFFAVAPLLCALVENDIQMTLYISQVASGPGTNQAVVVQGSSNSFGMTAVVDWPILDEPPADPSAKVVGRAQGFHMLSSPVTEFGWYTSMNLVFKDQSQYNGSTLHVIGISPFTSEWSIVGGTGKFSMARGIVKYTVDDRPSARRSDRRLYTLNVHAYYYSMDSTAIDGKTGCNCNSRRSEPIADN